MVLASEVINFFPTRILRNIMIVGAASLATACASGGGYQTNNGGSWGAPDYHKSGKNSKYAKASRGRQLPSTRGSSGGHQKIGRPYTVSGKTYVPARDDNYNRVGIGSWYGPNFHGKKTANGETFDQNAMTAAHPTLPLPSVVRVTNLGNGKQILVRVNDRGPFVDNRMIDLSKRAATELGYKSKGIAKLRVEYIGPARLNGARLPIRQTSASTRPESRANIYQAVVKQKPVQKAANIWPEDPAKKYSIALSRPRTSASGWFVQAGAYSNKGRAKQIASNMHLATQPIVQTAYVNNRYIYRVLVGPFAQKSQAVSQHAEVVAAGFVKARVTEQN
ncbi:MAG: hypothetical protein COA47_07645 [Robiginitomaculum sp.]|nr:MAG: hypothetical protein COA47_07645 [Robiginitomaculum sp.]